MAARRRGGVDAPTPRLCGAGSLPARHQGLVRTRVWTSGCRGLSEDPPPTPSCQETADNDRPLWGFQSLPTHSFVPLSLQRMELLAGTEQPYLRVSYTRGSSDNFPDPVFPESLSPALLYGFGFCHRRMSGLPGGNYRLLRLTLKLHP
ncbi:hypothetical protein E5288_WYG000026 [Bos mutus]|uniref:Uncharacterized protein n=1 Tax=Bos mutus TaxID=72004 RepID=A0A6B0RHD0_9CETA|nr:hypothetical protein [Bos mutus]